MALVWEQNDQLLNYQVRSAGKSIRLYTNGVFHSQYHPDHVFNGGVWDALSLPSLFVEPSPQRILLLGVGGGTAIHQLQKLVSPKNITGIEINAMHIHVAKNFFHLNYDNLELLNTDAIPFIQSCGLHFDMIVDDIFLEGINDPYRPVTHESAWLNSLADLLSPGGILVQNHLSQKDASRFFKAHDKQLNKRFASGLAITLPYYDNCIHSLLKYPVSIKEVRSRAERKISETLTRKESHKLRYELRRLF